MAHFFQIERTAGGTIARNAIARFEHIKIKSNEKHPLQDMIDPVLTDFIELDEEGALLIKRPGSFVIQWYMAAASGLATDGQAFELRQFNAESEQWEKISEGSSHLKPSSSSGFGVTLLTPSNSLKYGHLKVALFNSSNHDVTLSPRVKTKSALLIFSLADESLADGMQASLLWDLAGLGKVIPEKANIPFDQVLSKSYYGGIKLSDTTGVVEITNPGKYQVSWHVPIRTVDYADEALLALYVDGIPYTYSYMPNAFGAMNGSALIDVNYNETTRLKLVNLAGCNIRLGKHSNISVTYICPPVVPSQNEAVDS